MPALHRALVDPGAEEVAATRRPLVAAAASHFLGGEKFSKPERGIRRLAGRGDGPVFAGGKIGDPQRAVADVGDQPPGGVGPGVGCRGQGRNLAYTGPARAGAVTVAASGTGSRPGPIRPVHLSRQAEHGQPDVGVAAESNDAGGLLAGTLPA